MKITYEVIAGWCERHRVGKLRKARGGVQRHPGCYGNWHQRDGKRVFDGAPHTATCLACGAPADSYGGHVHKASEVAAARRAPHQEGP